MSGRLQSVMINDCNDGIAFMKMESPRHMPCPSLERTSYPGLIVEDVNYIGASSAMEEIFDLIRRVAASQSNVLVVGESGTGKELVTKAIHHLSPRRNGRLVALNCCAIPRDMLESELFGHVKGAFTGAAADRVGRFLMAKNGTLMLDEISEMPLDLQAKLLRVIQEKKFEPLGSCDTVHSDCRIVAATNRDLEDMVQARSFREDLYYRLAVIPINIPPLRERVEDIPVLVEYFLDKMNRERGCALAGVTDDAMDLMMSYSWPGNVRQLENAIERAAVLKGKGIITPRDLGPRIKAETFAEPETLAPATRMSFPEEGIDFNQALKEYETFLIGEALRRTSGNKNKAAGLLNLKRTTLVEKIKRHGIDASDDGQEQAPSNY